MPSFNATYSGPEQCNFIYYIIREVDIVPPGFPSNCFTFHYGKTGIEDDHYPVNRPFELPHKAHVSARHLLCLT